MRFTRGFRCCHCATTILEMLSLALVSVFDETGSLAALHFPFKQPLAQVDEDQAVPAELQDKRVFLLPASHFVVEPWQIVAGLSEVDPTNC